MRFWYCPAGLAAVGLATLCLDASCASAQDCPGLVGKNFHDARIVETGNSGPPAATVVTILGSHATVISRTRSVIA
jgi:hypothetical protein